MPLAESNTWASHDEHPPLGDQDDRAYAPGWAPGRGARAAAMTALIASRIAQLVLLTVLISVLVLALLRLVPGDPALSILGPRATPETLAALREQLGLNRSFGSQVAHSLALLAQGDLGRSLISDQPVTSIVGAGLGVTMPLIGLTTAVALIVGIPIGLLTALREWKGADTAVNVLNAALLSTPPMLAGVFLLLFAAVKAHLAPAGGWAGSWPGNFRYLWLPSLALSLYLTPYIIRTVRHAAREANAQQYVEAAITRGIPPSRVAIRHVLPNSLIPLITVIGFNASVLIGGAVVVEAIFNLPGVGGVLTTAVSERDFTVIQGVAVAIAIIVVAVNLLSDLLYRAVDPRIRARTG